MTNERLTMRTPEGACLIINATNEQDAREELYEKFKLACNKLADLEDKIEHEELVEVVRCKKCKYHNWFACSRKPGQNVLAKDNDFCSYGVRKDGKTNDSV